LHQERELAPATTIQIWMLIAHQGTLPYSHKMRTGVTARANSRRVNPFGYNLLFLDSN
jgi:hypothetical protein